MGACLELSDLQERLIQQYARLRDCRVSENYSVYAIEHGLTVDEASHVQELLNNQLASSMRADRAHWLVWVAAATEVGYRYDGLEYWDSFERAFPKWRQVGDRNQIRNWFKRFATDFNGLLPSGPWARQFPIIAWPITQAILPRYLQRHFADHLYQLRHALGRSTELTLDDIGDVLSERYIGHSSRFVGFLQQKALTARIVMALGLEDVAEVVSPIENVTLDRIVRDFDKLGSSGLRLREARRVLRNARFINSSKPGYIHSARTQDRVEESPANRTEQPRLIARPIDAQTWSILLTIPDLATPLRRAGLSPQDFERARVRFRPHDGRSAWIPGRALFSYTGKSSEPLLVYPITEHHAFEFDRTLTKAETVLRERLTLPAKRLRLLKVRGDGSAFEVIGQHVRGNESYLLVASYDIAKTVVETLRLVPLQAGLADSSLWRLDLHKSVTSEQIEALKSLGLGYVLSVRLDPLGLTPRWNLANGSLEFLDTETVLFRLSSDVAVGEYSIAVDEGSTVRFKPTTANDTIFSLGSMAVGSHRIAVSAIGVATGSKIETEEIAIEVRPANPWQNAISGKAGISVNLEPREAPLEQFIDGDALIRIVAPPNRYVKLEACFYSADGSLFHEEMLCQFGTPILDQKLSDLVIQKLTSDRQIEFIERAVRIELVASLDEFGSDAIRFEKDAEPLRWLRLDETSVRLSDDSGEEAHPTVECYDLNAAEQARTVEYHEALEEIKLVGKGGLLVATHNGRRYAAVVTAMQSQLGSFSDLGIPAHIATPDVRPDKLINALKRWRSTRRLIGPMAFMARRNAIRELAQRLEYLLCGKDWVDAVDAVRTGNVAIGELYGRVFYSRGYASGLRAYQWLYETEEAASIGEFLRLNALYKVCDDVPLSRLALKLAFRPSGVSRSDLPSKTVFETLKTNPALIRGAYFARLATEVRMQSAKSEAA